MDTLSKKQLDHLHSLLDEREQELRAETRHEIEQQDNFAQLASEVPDPGDSSFADLSVDLNNAALNRDMVELRAIEAARKRMEAGTYGVCIECEIPIPYERLEAQPTADRCAPCQGMFEKTHIDAQKGATL